MSLSVVIITCNEEANLPRTLKSVQWADEIIVVDSGSTDRTLRIAGEFKALTFVEPWKGYAAQKNSAIAKARADWTLSLDADEELDPEMVKSIRAVVKNVPAPSSHERMEDSPDAFDAYWLPRKNFFLNQWIRYGGFYPDHKLRLFRTGMGRVEERAVHETIKVTSKRVGTLEGNILHHAYPTLAGYIEHMNRYSSLAGEMLAVGGKTSGSWPAFILNVVYRPYFNFVWNFIFRGGFLDGRRGLLLHLYHNVYVSWKYAKAWEAGGNVSSSKKKAAG